MLTRLRIAVLDDWERVAEQSADWSAIRDFADVDFWDDHVTDGALLVQRLEPYDAIVLMRERTPLGPGLINALPRLRLVVTTGPRNASIDLATCTGKGITVCHTDPGTGPVVELAWSLILGCMRDLPAMADSMEQGHWTPRPGQELRGARLGLLGLGRTGSRMARIAQAFDMEVLAWSPNLTPERAHEHGARLVTRSELFAESDIVSLHLVLAEATRNLVGREDLHRLGPSSWLINTSRAGLVDEDSLVTACTEGWIAGAALDVYDVEPLPANHRLRKTPRLMMTPHIGYVTAANLRSWYQDVVDDILGWQAGSPIRLLSS